MVPWLSGIHARPRWPSLLIDLYNDEPGKLAQVLPLDLYHRFGILYDELCLLLLRKHSFNDLEGSKRHGFSPAFLELARNQALTFPKAS